MFSNSIPTTLQTKTEVRMDVLNRTLSSDALQAEWVEVQAAQQNPTAFKPIYERYYEPIFRYVLNRCSDENLTADLCSQVFLKALQKIHTYAFKGVPFSAWLYRIASNEVAQFYRNTKKARVISAEDADLSEMMDEINAEEVELAEVHHKFLLEVLQEIPLEDIQLIEMRFFEKRPFKEIADILDITESNAKVKTYRLLEKLKQKILKKFK